MIDGISIESLCEALAPYPKRKVSKLLFCKKIEYCHNYLETYKSDGIQLLSAINTTDGNSKVYICERSDKRLIILSTNSERIELLTDME